MRGCPVLFAVLVALGLLTPLPSHAAPPSKTRLVVVVVVDQLRGEDLELFAPLLGANGLGGLGKKGELVEGRYLTANTETAPGHATLSTGTYSHEHGVVNNTVMTVAGPRMAVADQNHPVWGNPNTADGRSPLMLRVPTVGDQLKLSTGGKARVVAVAGKDRSAILTGGYAADVAVWFDTAQLAFVSSSYYAPAPPAWLDTFNAAHPAASHNQWRWELALPAERYAPYARPDVSPGESARLGLPNTFPKVLDPAVVPQGRLGAALRMTPRLDALTLDLALAAVDGLELGRDDVPDLLWVGLSAYDLIGHAYGPYALERADALVRLSSALKAFVEALEKRVGAGRLSLVLTADHGVTPIPEDSAALRIPSGRVHAEQVSTVMDGVLDRAVAPRDWVKLVSPPHVWLDAPPQAPLTCDMVDRAARAALELPSVARAVATCRLELMSGDTWDMFKRAHDPQRGGQIMVELRPGFVWEDTYEVLGTDHGSTWVHDQRVPVLVVSPSHRMTSAAKEAPGDMRQVAPTISTLLGIPPPPAGRQAPLVQKR